MVSGNKHVSELQVFSLMCCDGRRQEHLECLCRVARAQAVEDALPAGVDAAGGVKVQGAAHILVLDPQEGVDLAQAGGAAPQARLYGAMHPV